MVRACSCVLVYQHFPRRERVEYVRATARLIMERTSATQVLTFRTSSVVFFLAPQMAMMEIYNARSWIGDKGKDIIGVDTLRSGQT